LTRRRNNTDRQNVVSEISKNVINTKNPRGIKGGLTMSKARKLFVIFLAVTFMATTGLAILTNSADAQTINKEGWPTGKFVIATGGGGESGPNYPMAAALGTMMQKYLGISVVLTPTSGHDATHMMNKKEAYVGFPNLQSAVDALKGTGPVEKLGPTAQRAFAQAMMTENIFITLKKSGIKTFADLKGKIVCIGPVATPTPKQLMETLCAAYGIDPKSIKTVGWDRATEPFEGLQAGRFDAALVTSAYPGSAMQEFFLSNDARIISIDDKQIEAVRKALPWFRKIQYPANAYKGMDQPAQTVGIPVFMATIRDLPDSLVYEMTKLVYDRNEEFTSYHPANKQYKAKDVGLVVDICPYHNGAIKYYREKGIWTKEMDQRQAASLAALPPSVR
jgi:TRAP transporter TAXI family solute receptor